jgi:hypothetical protein
MKGHSNPDKPPAISATKGLTDTPTYMINPVRSNPLRRFWEGVAAPVQREEGPSCGKYPDVVTAIVGDMALVWVKTHFTLSSQHSTPHWRM